jgi:hypothetical protein
MMQVEAVMKMLEPGLQRSLDPRRTRPKAPPLIFS